MLQEGATGIDEDEEEEEEEEEGAAVSLYTCILEKLNSNLTLLTDNFRCVTQ
jgi:hypothetical protein